MMKAKATVWILSGLLFCNALPAGHSDFRSLRDFGSLADSCVDDTWTSTNTVETPSARVTHAAVWTGTEMIVWGGFTYFISPLNTGGRYDPATDRWTATSNFNAPFGRRLPTAIWTGREMIVWGGAVGIDGSTDTGGRYDPEADTWAATSLVHVPSDRVGHTAIWTGTEMIVWGGFSGEDIKILNNGGRYHPVTDTWADTSLTDAPSPRENHVAVWTGTEMIIWGGAARNDYLNSGARYDPETDAWTAISLDGAPSPRHLATAVWTGSEMIVWGGIGAGGVSLNDGGRYHPQTDTWTAISSVGAPSARVGHTAVWTGSEMIVWGGGNNVSRTLFDSGGRYDPVTDTWVDTSRVHVPSPRSLHTAVWTDTEMIVWGGGGDRGALNTGGRYCVGEW